MLRRETKKYLIMEFKNYKKSLRELRKDRERLNRLQLLNTGAVEISYLINRIWWLDKVTSAISAVYEDMDSEELMIAKAKFRPGIKLSDAEIIEKLPLEKSAYYDKLRHLLIALGRKLGLEV